MTIKIFEQIHTQSDENFYAKSHVAKHKQKYTHEKNKVDSCYNVVIVRRIF